MTLGERIEARRKALGIKSQSALARMVPMNQSTLNGLIRNPYRWSPYLPALARALQTTVEYLVGETDEPTEKAPPPPPLPTVHHVMMAVALPSQHALARMFDAMLEALPPEARRDEQADLMARWLPTALAQLRDLLPPGTSAPMLDREAAKAPREDLALQDHGSQP